MRSDGATKERGDPVFKLDSFGEMVGLELREKRKRTIKTKKRQISSKKQLECVTYQTNRRSGAANTGIQL